MKSHREEECMWNEMSLEWGDTESLEAGSLFRVTLLHFHLRLCLFTCCSVSVRLYIGLVMQLCPQHDTTERYILPLPNACNMYIDNTYPYFQFQLFHLFNFGCLITLFCSGAYWSLEGFSNVTSCDTASSIPSGLSTAE